MSETSRNFIDIEQAAAYLGVNERTIRNYIARGIVPGYRIHGSRLIRIDLNELDALPQPIPTVQHKGQL